MFVRPRFFAFVLRGVVHALHEVGADDRAAGADTLGDGKGRLASAAGEVEHMQAGLEIGRLDEGERRVLRRLGEGVVAVTPGFGGVRPLLADALLELGLLFGCHGRTSCERSSRNDDGHVGSMPLQARCG